MGHSDEVPAARRRLRSDIEADWRARASRKADPGAAADDIGAATVVVLFVGQSGTGKTMAAERLASALHLALHRVDVSAVVSKYIGETEKNLERVFAAAECASAVLYFDEADALFGKRSEVKDSHDRYANIEVGYLLERIEAFHGIVVLASNSRKDIDDAFLRRVRYVVPFTRPAEAER
jgi:SpoVK/Ycf46/Vps4 family AAA+-type ATPase